jgi:hypothetical protein
MTAGITIVAAMCSSSIGGAAAIAARKSAGCEPTVNATGNFSPRPTLAR